MHTRIAYTAQVSSIDGVLVKEEQDTKIKDDEPKASSKFAMIDGRR